MTEQGKIKDQMAKLQTRLEELEKLPELKEGDVCEVWINSIDKGKIFNIVRFDGFNRDGIFMDMFGDPWKHYRKLTIAPEWEVVPEDDIEYHNEELAACLREDGELSIAFVKSIKNQIDYKKPVSKFLRLPRV